MVNRKNYFAAGYFFFTFQQIAYLVDSYKKITKEYRFVHYALFVTFFPQLIARPIVHHKEMLPQFQSSNAFRISRGRRPYPLMTMLRIHCLQQWYSLSDPGMEDALYEIGQVRVCLVRRLRLIYEKLSNIDLNKEVSEVSIKMNSTVKLSKLASIENFPPQDQQPVKQSP